MSEVVKFAKSIRLDVDKLLGDWIVCIPGFTLEKYRRLQKSQLSILSMNCFGGLLSHLLGLKTLSPFFNLRTDTEEDFLKFLKHPRIYIEEDLDFKETRQSRDFMTPVYSIGDMILWMVHDKDFDKAVAKWNERKKRINWYNLIAIMDTDKPDILEKFDSIPYSKKVCFVPFKSNLYSAFYMNPKFTKNGVFTGVIGELSQIVPEYYDVFDMLLYGKKTPLIDM